MRERGMKAVTDWVKGVSQTEVRSTVLPYNHPDGRTGIHQAVPPSERKTVETESRPTVKTTLVLPVDIYRALKVRAAETGTQMCDLATEALAALLKVKRPAAADDSAA